MNPFTAAQQQRPWLSAALVGVLSACAASGPTIERSAGGAAIDLSARSEQQQSQARDQLRDQLTRGVATYRLVPGDTIELLYLTGNQPEGRAYRIAVGDRLRLEFDGVDEAARVLLVRPDGVVTLPRKGEIAAAGVEPLVLAKNITARYADLYIDPRVTVIVEQYTSRLDDLKTALTHSQRGRSQRLVVGPDGRIALPFLSTMQVAGRTVDEVRDEVNAQFKQRIGDVEVSVVLDGITGNRVFVFGEVPRPGVVAGAGNLTVLQAVASAGGVLPTGAATQIKVLYWGDQERGAVLRTVNLDRVMAGLHVAEDLVLPGNSTIYVPPSAITGANRAIDQYLRQMFLFNGVNLGFTYELRAAQPK